MDAYDGVRHGFLLGDEERTTHVVQLWLSVVTTIASGVSGHCCNVACIETVVFALFCRWQSAAANSSN